jgi:phenylalanyl-tRNA synthetase beta chain
VIADAHGAESLGAVIGGASTGCDETTREVFIECALFDPVRIARSGRRHNIFTDARARNERGLDPALMRPALEAATRMIQELCGGEASTVTEAGAEPEWRRTATLRFARIAGLGGLDLAPDEAVARLERLGFAVAARDDASVTVQVPSWRNDIAAPIVLDQAPGLDPARAARAAEGCAAVEGECDLLEEVLRLGGLDAIPAVSLPALGAVPLPLAGCEASARPTCPARAGGARADGMRDLWLHRAARGGDVRRHAGGAAAGEPDRLRPRPDAAHAAGLAGPGRGAQRGARLAGPGARRGGRGYRDTTPTGQLAMACGLRTGARRSTGPALHARWMRWTPRPMRWPCWKRSACRWRACR